MRGSNSLVRNITGTWREELRCHRLGAAECTTSTACETDGLNTKNLQLGDHILHQLVNIHIRDIIGTGVNVRTSP